MQNEIMHDVARVQGVGGGGGRGEFNLPPQLSDCMFKGELVTLRRHLHKVLCIILNCQKA